LAKHDKMTYNW